MGCSVDSLLSGGLLSILRMGVPVKYWNIARGKYYCGLGTVSSFNVEFWKVVFTTCTTHFWDWENLDLFLEECGRSERDFSFKTQNDLYFYFFSVYSTHSWTKLNHCPYCGFSLVVIAGLVTAIGGYNSRKQEDSNKLVSLMDGKWVEYYPPMPTCRYYTTAVVTPKKVIVAGGSVKNNVRVHTVEVMDIETKEWSKVASLPKALSSSCSVVYGDNAFLIGGFDAHGRPSSTVLTCSVNELIQSAFPPTERENMTPIDMSGTPWRTLPDLPVTYSHCTIVNGHLVTVGGMKASKRPTGDIFHYDPSTSSWEVIGGVPTPRYCSVTVTLPSKELIVVGGLSGGNNTDCINICEAASF